MWCTRWIALSALLAVGIVGCGGSDKTDQGSASDGVQVDTAQTGQAGAGQVAQQTGPDAAVQMFLEAVRAADHQRTSEMLTSTARQVMAELDMVATPSGSQTAEFEIGQVEYLSGDGARVACTLSDLDANSQRRTEQLIWMVRREPEGWRIAGVAAHVGDGTPQALNFEDREQMAALNARGKPTTSQVQRPEEPAAGIRRSRSQPATDRRSS